MTTNDVIAAWAAGAMAMAVALGGLMLASTTSTVEAPAAVRSLESAGYGGAGWAIDRWEATGTIPARRADRVRHPIDGPVDPIEEEAMNSVLAGP